MAKPATNVKTKCPRCGTEVAVSIDDLLASESLETSCANCASTVEMALVPTRLGEPTLAPPPFTPTIPNGSRPSLPPPPTLPPELPPRRPAGGPTPFSPARQRTLGRRILAWWDGLPKPAQFALVGVAILILALVIFLSDLGESKKDEAAALPAKKEKE